MKSCNHVLLKSCFQSFFPDWNISFNLAFNIEIRCKKREKKRPLKTLSRFVLRCPDLSCAVPFCPPTTYFTALSRPEKGLQKRVNLMQQTTNSDLSRHYLPRQLRHLILQEYLSGVKTARQLSEEHGIPMSTIHKMGQRWKAKNSCSFVSTPNPYPIMSRVTSEEASELLSENKALRRRLEEALLRLEGYEIMGDILQEEYGIDLLKKSAAGQSSVSKKDTQQ
ncbi:hypothetical protein [Alistipes putredinis]